MRRYPGAMLDTAEGKWLAAPRLLHHEDLYHLFYLQGDAAASAPRALRRSTSADLLTWSPSAPVLECGPPGAWDDLSLGGCGVLQHGGRCYCLYTGHSRADRGRIDRLGLAWTEDFVTWQRHPGNPFPAPDPAWYESAETGAETVTWRDPFVWQDPADGYIYALICARVRSGDPATRGCLALARSTDLIDWQCLPPAYAPSLLPGYLLPEFFDWQGQRVLLFGSEVGGYRTDYLTVDSLSDLARAGAASWLVGGPQALEGSVTTAATLKGRGAVHLACSGEPAGERSYPRGRLALPKTLQGVAEQLWLTLRRDLYTSPINCLDCSQLVVDQLECWHAEGDNLHGKVVAGRTFLPLASRGNRTASAVIAIEGEGEAGYVIGYDEVLVALSSEEEVVVRIPSRQYVRHWPVSARSGELSVVVMEGHIEVYFNRRFLGTACPPQKGERPLALFCAGTLSIIFSGVAVKTFELEPALATAGV